MGRNLWFPKPRAVRNLILSACSWRWVGKCHLWSRISCKCHLWSCVSNEFPGVWTCQRQRHQEIKREYQLHPQSPWFLLLLSIWLISCKVWRGIFLILLVSGIRGFHLKPKMKQISCVWGQEKLFPAVFPGFWHICDLGWHYYKLCRVWWGQGKWVLSFEMAGGSTDLA